MEHNIIALIWDFDKTLVNGYMQTPIFEKYEVNEDLFWKEVNNLEKEYLKQNVKINRDTIYLNHFLTCVEQGVFKGLNNKMLFDLGAKLNFYKGIPDIFRKLKDNIHNNEEYKKFNISIEHYIVSTGISEMIKGSSVAQYVDGIWGCEFIERPIKSCLHIKEYEKTKSENNDICEIKQIGYTVDNTSKTRAIFEINKGSNKYPAIQVNDKMDEADRRVPFENMIYIADGPSDVPAFSVLKQNGGRTFAIYPHGNYRALEQVDQLRRDGRIDMYGEADYSEDTTTYMWLKQQTEQIANRIYQRKMNQIRSSVSKAPEHLID